MLFCRTLLALAVALPASQAFATGEIESLITTADRARLERYEETRAQALEVARKGGAAEDIATLDAVLAGEPAAFADFDLTGDWRCRTIKAGGSLPLVVYGWFKCRVSDDGSGWVLEKTTGSQRTKGRFFTDSDTRLAYLGAFYVNDDAAPPYGSGPESDQAGYAFRTGEAEWRIEFPEPYYESKLDILEVRR
jgi:hypothetical protein